MVDLVSRILKALYLYYRE